VKEISLIEALADCTTSCGWCAHHCPDEHKYEILVACIRLQEEFIKLYGAVYLILAGRSTDTIEKISKLFEKLAGNIQRQGGAKITATRERNGGEVWGLTGCSHIFLVAQALEQTYLNEINRTD